MFYFGAQRGVSCEVPWPRVAVAVLHPVIAWNPSGIMCWSALARGTVSCATVRFGMYSSPWLRGAPFARSGEKHRVVPRSAEVDAGVFDSMLHRPTEAWLPRGTIRRREALGFACVSGLRADRLQTFADALVVVLGVCEDFKRSYTRTPILGRRPGFVSSHGL